VANTPNRLLPPRRGGRTVGENVLHLAWENSHINQMWLVSSRPRSASTFLNSGSNTIFASRDFAIPLCLGIPNLVGKSLFIVAIFFISFIYGESTKKY
jgi:hypothetical protein